MTPSKVKVYSLSILFSLILFFPLLNDNFNLFKDLPNTENRKLSAKPVIDLGYLDPFPISFEKYYNDTFAIRNRLIHYFNLFNIIGIKKSPYPDKVIIGKNNWLFVSNLEIETYQAKNILSNEKLEILRKEFESRANYLNALNCKFYLVIAPLKANIYSEMLPSTVLKTKKLSMGKQLINYLNKKSNVKAIDLFSYLKNKKGEDLLYYKLDTHWNSLGAFYASNCIVNQMQNDFKELKELDINEFTINTQTIEIGNIKNMLGNLDYYEDIEYTLTPKKGFLADSIQNKNYPVIENFPYPFLYERHREIQNSTKPKLLIFSDSYGDHIFPFLSENFRHTTKIFGAWNYVIDKKIVEIEKPDAVILLIYEPIIPNVFNNLNK
jgi:hypothetical protein